MRIAIIIPVLNEAAIIETCLQSLQVIRQRGHQLIVVDGGSQDNTVDLAKPLADEVLITDSCRSAQMNRGAELADAEILLFLHADTKLPENADGLIIESLFKGHLWGRFNVSFTANKWIFKIIAYFINLRSCLTSIATGDQAIFVEKELFDQLGRFPNIALMEDVQLSINLKKKQRSHCLTQSVITSSRRWEKHGVFRVILLMWWLRIAYFFGVPVEKLSDWYHK